MTLVRLFVFFGGLLAIGLFTLLIGPYFVDWSVYRADFEREASRIIGQKVAVQGETELRLLPFPSITFNDLEIGENRNGQPMMTASKFEMDLEITPFLNGEILVFDMRVEKPDLTVTLFDDGTLDWALRSEKQLAGNTLVLENISIENGSIRLVDLQNDRSQRFDNINANLSAPELKGPWRIDGTTDYEAQEIAYSLSTGVANPKGTIRLRSTIKVGDLPLFLNAEGDAEIKDNKPSYKGSFSIQKHADKNVLNTAAEYRQLLSINLKGDFEINNEWLNVPEFRLASGNQADPYVIEGNAEIDTGQDPKFEILARGQQIDVEQLSNNNIQASQAGQSAVRNGLDRLRDIINQIPTPQMQGTIDLSLPAIVAGDTTVRDVKLIAAPLHDGSRSRVQNGLQDRLQNGMQGGWQIDQFNAKLPGRTSIEADGKLLLGDKVSFAGDILIASQQPSGLSSWLIGSVDPEIRQLVSAGISARVLLNNDIQKFNNLELVLGNSAVRGDAERQHIDGQNPTISFDLTGDEIHINKITALLRLANLGNSTNENSGFLSHDIIAKIDTDLMRYNNVWANGVQAIINWQSGNLLLEKVQFEDFAGMTGSVSGSIEQLNSEPIGQVDYAITAQDPTPFFNLMSDFGNEHAIIERIVQKSDQFNNLSSIGSLEIGSDHIPVLNLSGDANGTIYDIRASGQSLLPQIFENASTPLDFQINAQNPKSYILLSQAGFNVLPFDFEEGGELDIKISRGFSPDMDVEASFKTENTTIETDGFINFTDRQELEDATGNLTVVVKSKDIEPLLLGFGHNLPGPGSGQPLDMQTSMRINNETISLSDIIGNADGNPFSGKLDLERAKQNPTLSGNLEMGQVDFEWLYELTLGARIFEFSDATWSQTAFLTPFEGAPFADLTVISDKVLIPGLDTMTGFRATLALEPGILALSDMQASWYKGQLDGEFSISNPDGKAFVSMRGQLNNADISQLTWVYDDKAKLTGKIDISGNLEGTGISLEEIVQSANGGGIYNLKNMSIDGFQPDMLGDIIASIDQKETGLEPDEVGSLADTFSQQGSYDIPQLSVPFTLTGGVQRISSISLDDEDFSTTGRARFDLTKNVLDAQMNVVYDAGLETQVGATPELTFSFDGAINAPNRSIDANAMSNFLSIRAYENERRRVELLQASILEKQRLRREIALVRDQQLRREEQARLKAEEEARLKAEEEARKKAELEARLAAEAEAQRLADEALERARNNTDANNNDTNNNDTSGNVTRDNGTIGTLDLEKTIQDILNDTNLSRDGIEVTPLDAPTSQ